MKHITITALAAALCCTGLQAQHKHIQFDTLTLAAARAKAAVENKLIFADCSTSWCVPCKHMEAKVFTLDSVADYFNTSFINIRLDMDQPAVKAAAKPYDIGAFPSYLLVDKDGRLVFKMAGAMPANEFMAKMRAGANPANEVATMNARYAAGERGNTFMRDYILQKIRLMEIEPAQKLNQELMQLLTPAEKAKPENWVLFGINRYAMYLSEAGSINFPYLAEHWKDFAATVGKDTVDKKLSAVYEKIAGTFVSGQYRSAYASKKYHPEDIALFKKQIAATEMPDKDQLLVMMDMAEAAVQKDYAKVTALLQAHVDHFSQANQHIVFDYITMGFSIPHNKYEGFGVIADKVIRTSKNPHLIKICEQYKQRELNERAQ